jgi:hypothetical protein
MTRRKAIVVNVGFKYTTTSGFDVNKWAKFSLYIITINATTKSTKSINTDAILIKIMAFYELPSPRDLPTQDRVPIYPPNGTINMTIYALRAII